MSGRAPLKRQWGAELLPILIGVGVFSAMAVKGFFSPLGISERFPDLEALRLRLLGQRREAVRSMLGIPRTSAVAQDITGDPAVIGAWYYVVSRPGRSAMAVSFEGDVVKEVEFITAKMAAAH